MRERVGLRDVVRRHLDVLDHLAAMRGGLDRPLVLVQQRDGVDMDYSNLESRKPHIPETTLMLNAPLDTLDWIVVATDKKFYAALGQRIAERRKTLGLTQQQVAESLGIAQQTLAHYEVGRLRVAAALLPVFSKVLGLSLDELLGESPSRSGKPGPASRLQIQMERISSLPRSKQRMLIDMLDAAINSADAQAS